MTVPPEEFWGQTPDSVVRLLHELCLRAGLVVEQLSPLRNLFLENVKFLGSLRSVATIRDKVLDLILLITSAERAAILQGCLRRRRLQEGGRDPWLESNLYI